MMQHLAVVMDGNRRWAKKNKLSVLLGHGQGGVDAAKRTVEFCLKNSIPYLSLYTFSLENFKRSPEEQHYLFELLVAETAKQLDDFIAKGIRVRFVGDRSLFPARVIPACNELEEKTKNCSRLNLIILFCYGARQELYSAALSLAKKMEQGLLSATSVTQKDFEDCLWTRGLPNPDLIIRTGGARRLSNFLLYQGAYTELYFLDCLWPEVTQEDLKKAVDFFAETQRNFGS